MQAAHWRQKELPALRRDAHDIWVLGRQREHGATGMQGWQEDTAMLQARLA